jgi:hypothetical protein
VKMEAVQRAKLDVEARRKHPSEAGFLSADQWYRRLGELCEEYNGTAQDSKVIGGKMSPNEAWRILQKQNDAGEVEPLVMLPNECRYLLATHTRRVRIGRNGITLPKSLGGGNYRNEITGRLQGREVSIYFDLEFPDLLSIVSDDRKQVFTVPIAPTCPAHDATPEEMAAAQANMNAHTAYARQRISQLRAEYMPPTRGNLVDPKTSALGREIKAQQEEAQARKIQRQRTQKPRVEVASALGVGSTAIANLSAAQRLQQSIEALKNES